LLAEIFRFTKEISKNEADYLSYTNLLQNKITMDDYKRIGNFDELTELELREWI
jgi:hypothetical protein